MFVKKPLVPNKRSLDAPGKDELVDSVKQISFPIEKSHLFFFIVSVASSIG
jgi:hypothetical protein